MRKVTIVFGDDYDVNYSIVLDDQLVQQMQTQGRDAFWIMEIQREWTSVGTSTRLITWH